MYVCMYVCPYVDRDRKGERFLLRNLFTQLWRLGSPKSAGLADRLEIQKRVHIATQIQRQSGGKISSSLGDLSLFSL